MDLKAILKARNLTDEQADKLIGDPAYATILEAFVKEAEDGKTSYQKAQEIERNLKTWNETQVVPYVRGADERVAKTEAKLAKAMTHMKTLQTLGYDIGEGWDDVAPPAAPPAKSESGYDPKEFDKKIYDGAMTNMALVSLSNRHRKLVGDELDLESEFTDFERNKRPQETLRTYVARKYDHEGLQAKSAQAAEQKKLDDYAATKVQEEKAKWAQSNGVNPETRNPKSSRFDQIAAEPERKQLWQTRVGREQATKNRLEKYTSQITQ